MQFNIIVCQWPNELSLRSAAGTWLQHNDDKVTAVESQYIASLKTTKVESHIYFSTRGQHYNSSLRALP
eukprot:1502129-Amphidinium_carterae.1